MGRRRETIGRAITHSIIHDEARPGLCASLFEVFYLYWLDYTFARPELFSALRRTWRISDEDFRSSFEAPLAPLGDMGFSGSTFFGTADTRYLVKSIPRRFEHSFFRDELLMPYVEHLTVNHRSLLVRITAFLQSRRRISLGRVLGTAPSHHVIMENIKYDDDNDNRSLGEGNGEDGEGEDASSDWETFDLKPMSYFYPERDVAGGALTSEATKSRLADEFDNKILLTLDQAEEFKLQLARDTRLLADCNAVDYSLFLLRRRTRATSAERNGKHHGRDGSWREGIQTADGKYLYRATILDFFWATHKTYAKFMTGLIRSYNVIDRQGPMSVTTTAPEYRERFLKMCHDIVQVA